MHVPGPRVLRQIADEGADWSEVLRLQHGGEQRVKRLPGSHMLRWVNESLCHSVSQVEVVTAEVEERFGPGA